MGDIVKLARSTYCKDTQISHWRGCEDMHSDCMILKLASEVERLRAELASAERECSVRAERELGYLARAQMAEAALAAQPTAGWIACSERMPPQGEDVLVWLSEPAFKGGPHVVFDCWDEQHEAPVSFSSATLPVGPGWDSGAYFEQISHWMPLPPPPDAPR